MTTAVDPNVALLTSGQLAAITTPLDRVCFEAEPGSGKTTVAAQRFGILRYGYPGSTAGNADHRGVVALSFTRSATAELHHRVRQSWGRTAVRWPHRICTIDSLLCGVLEHLLKAGAINWPGGATTLDVRDSWAALGAKGWGKRWIRLALDGQDLVFREGWLGDHADVPKPAHVKRHVKAGTCTHDEVRDALATSLAREDVRAAVSTHLAASIRAVIVDEVFDANNLDLAIIRLMMNAGVTVTLVGDPWQALYAFRDAQPDLVPALVASTDTQTLPLTTSFRWRTDSQAKLASDLRSGLGVALSVTATPDVDVVLATQWQRLWDIDTRVLPLAFGSAKGKAPEAAATLLLNQLVRSVFGCDATYSGDALGTLRIEDDDAIRRLEDPLQKVLGGLRVTGAKALRAAYDALVEAVAPETSIGFPKVHANYTKRLQMVQQRILRTDDLVLGLSAHQAKGQEWEVVAICLSDSERARLTTGLNRDLEDDRKLYVACTRAHAQTVELRK